MDSDQTLQWLKDRTEITDLIYAFARNLDEKDYAGFVDLYSDDGYFKTRRGDPVPKAELMEDIETKLSAYKVTQHMMSNPQVNISGDTATSRSYVQAAHITDPSDPTSHWIVGGRYDNQYVRTPAGWRFASVLLTPLFHLANRPAWATG